MTHAEVRVLSRVHPLTELNRKASDRRVHLLCVCVCVFVRIGGGALLGGNGWSMEFSIVCCGGGVGAGVGIRGTSCAV